MRRVYYVGNWEDVFRDRAKPPGKTEQDRCANAEGAIRNAIKASDKLNLRDIKVFAQGSYHKSGYPFPLPFSKLKVLRKVKGLKAFGHNNNQNAIVIPLCQPGLEKNYLHYPLFVNRKYL